MTARMNPPSMAPHPNSSTASARQCRKCGENSPLLADTGRRYSSLASPVSARLAPPTSFIGTATTATTRPS